MTIVNCNHCNKNFNRSNKQFRRSKSKEFYCCIQCYGNYLKETRKGENNPAYLHGLIHAINEAKRRLKHECIICKFKGERLSVHHINGNHIDNPEDGSNWVILCNKCHRKIHSIMNHGHAGIESLKILKNERTVICPICNRRFEKVFYRKQKYCSTKCRKIGIKGKGNPNYKHGKRMRKTYERK